MPPQTKIEKLVSWIESLRWYFQCPHDIVTHFTMDGILEDKWERVSGGGECLKCRNNFRVSIPANAEERENKHYLGNPY